jgi:UDP-N-acetylmuramyl pentapeptide synthase
MAAENFDNLLTAGAIAKALGASDGKVKKAIKDLGIQPKAKKGVCAYYGKDVLPKVKATVAR